MRLYIVCSLVGLGIFLSLSLFAVLRREVNDFVAFVFCVVAVFLGNNQVNLIFFACLFIYCRKRRTYTVFAAKNVEASFMFLVRL